MRKGKEDEKEEDEKEEEENDASLFGKSFRLHEDLTDELNCRICHLG